MELSTLLEKIQLMAQSNVPVFSVAGITITEQQVIYLAVIILALALLLLLQTLLRPIVEQLSRGLRISRQEKKIAREIAADEEVSVVKIDSKSAESQTKNDETSLVDTSDRKRSLYDFVTPDTIHTEVLKQTLNNDYPYPELIPKQTEQSTATTSPEKPISTVEFAKVPATLPPLPGKPQPISPPPSAAPLTTIPSLTAVPGPIPQPAPQTSVPEQTVVTAQTTPIIPPAAPPVIAAPALPTQEPITPQATQTTTEEVTPKTIKAPVVTAPPPPQTTIPQQTILTPSQPLAQQTPTQKPSGYSPTDPLLP